MRLIALAGRQQAIGLMHKLAGMRFDDIIISPAIRTSQTAGVIAGLDYSSRIHEIASMYGSLDSKDHRDLLQMFEDLGYDRPLADYFKHCNDGALRRLSEECALDIYEDLGEAVSDKTILIVGHPVLLNGLLHFMFDEGAIKTLAATHVLGECGAIRVTTDDHGDAVAEVVANGRLETVTAVVH